MRPSGGQPEIEFPGHQIDHGLEAVVSASSMSSRFIPNSGELTLLQRKVVMCA